MLGVQETPKFPILFFDFLLVTHQEIIWQPKFRDMITCEHVVVFIQNAEEFDQ